MSEIPVPKEQGGTVDWSKAKVINFPGGGLISINGDITPAQIIGAATTPHLRFSDLGGGGHEIEFHADGYSTATTPPVPPGPPTIIPPGVETTILTIALPAVPQLFQMTAYAVLDAGGAPLTARARIYIDAAVVAEQSANFTPSANIPTLGFSFVSYAVNTGAPGILTLKIIQDSLNNITVLGATLNSIGLGVNP